MLALRCEETRARRLDPLHVVLGAVVVAGRRVVVLGAGGSRRLGCGLSLTVDPGDEYPLLAREAFEQSYRLDALRVGWTD